MTSEWADELVRQRKEKEEKTRVEEEARITDRKRIQPNDELKWKAIRSFIQELSDELNGAWGSKEVMAVNLSPTTIEVSAAGNNAIVQFIASDQKLKVSFYGAELYLSVNRHDQLVWQSSADRSKSWTDEDVAKRTVEYAWRPGNPPSRN